MKANIASKELARVLRNATLFQGDDTRPALLQCEITFQADQLQVVTTDSYALIIETVTADVPEDMVGNVGFITLKNAKPYMMLAKSDPGMTVMALDDQGVLELDSGTATFSFGPAGTFPNWRVLFPDEYDGLKETGTLGIGLWQLTRLGKVEPHREYKPEKNDNTTAARFDVVDALKPVRVTINPGIIVWVMPVIRLN